MLHDDSVKIVKEIGEKRIPICATCKKELELSDRAYPIVLDKIAYEWITEREDMELYYTYLFCSLECCDDWSKRNKDKKETITSMKFDKNILKELGII